MRPTALVALAAPLLFAAGGAVPKFEPDPCWPKPLPNNWMLGIHADGVFVKEGYIERKTSGAEGTAFDIAFSPDTQQQFFYVPDGTNKKVQILDREPLEVVGFFGGHGGHGAAEFYHVHSIASDSKGNIYLGESFGQRALKWAYKGGLP